MKPVTIWKRYNAKKQTYEHNHIEYDYNDRDVPEPINYDQRKAWEGAQWEREMGFINSDNQVITKFERIKRDINETL
jgi:hypothetical protein